MSTQCLRKCQFCHVPLMISNVWKRSLYHVYTMCENGHDAMFYNYRQYLGKRSLCHVHKMVNSDWEKVIISCVHSDEHCVRKRSLCHTICPNGKYLKEKSLCHVATMVYNVWGNCHCAMCTQCVRQGSLCHVFTLLYNVRENGHYCQKLLRKRCLYHMPTMIRNEWWKTIA